MWGKIFKIKIKLLKKFSIFYSIDIREQSKHSGVHSFRNLKINKERNLTLVLRFQGNKLPILKMCKNESILKFEVMQFVI